MPNISDDGQDKASQEAAGGVAENREPTPPHNQEGAKKRHSWLEKAAVFVAVLVVFATGFQGWVARDTEKRQLRAYMLPEKALLGNISSDQPELQVYAKNYGQTPAKNATIWVTWRYFDGAIKIPTDPPKDLQLSQYTIGPQGFVATGGPIQLDAEKKRRITDGTATFFAFGKIRYEDVFDRNWTTTFRFVWRKGFEPTSSGGIKVDTEGNEME